jgi:polar amino acid transport system permease protein
MIVPEILTYGRNGFADELLRGAFITVYIAVAAFTLALLLGQIGAMAKLYGGPIPRVIAGFYTTVFRAIPELVLILFLFFAGTRGISSLGVALGYGPIDVNGTLAAILVLGLVQGAYTTEVLRGAIQAIPNGQIEAARAYGMTTFQIFGRIIFPAMLPNAIPGLANSWLECIKSTSLIVVTGATSELMQATKLAAGFTKRYFLFYLVSGCIYLFLTLASNHLLQRLEHRVRRGQQKLA